MCSLVGGRRIPAGVSRKLNGDAGQDTITALIRHPARGAGISSFRKATRRFFAGGRASDLSSEGAATNGFGQRATTETSRDGNCVLGAKGTTSSREKPATTPSPARSRRHEPCGPVMKYPRLRRQNRIDGAAGTDLCQFDPAEHAVSVRTLDTIAVGRPPFTRGDWKALEARRSARIGEAPLRRMSTVHACAKDSLSAASAEQGGMEGSPLDVGSRSSAVNPPSWFGLAPCGSGHG